MGMISFDAIICKKTKQWFHVKWNKKNDFTLSISNFVSSFSSSTRSVSSKASSCLGSCSPNLKMSSKCFKWAERTKKMFLWNDSSTDKQFELILFR